MFHSQECRQDRPQGLKKKKKTFKKLGLVAAQRNGIAACAYSLKICTVQYNTVHTLLYMVCSIKTSFLSFFSINGPETTLFEVDC